MKPFCCYEFQDFYSMSGDSCWEDNNDIPIFSFKDNWYPNLVFRFCPFCGSKKGFQLPENIIIAFNEKNVFDFVSPMNIIPPEKYPCLVEKIVHQDIDLGESIEYSFSILPENCNINSFVAGYLSKSRWIK